MSEKSTNQLNHIPSGHLFNEAAFMKGLVHSRNNETAQQDEHRCDQLSKLMVCVI